MDCWVRLDWNVVMEESCDLSEQTLDFVPFLFLEVVVGILEQHRGCFHNSTHARSMEEGC